MGYSVCVCLCVFVRVFMCVFVHEYNSLLSSLCLGYVTMGAVPPGHVWSQQAFAAQAGPLFGVPSPMGQSLPVAQVLPGGQPLIWGQANLFPATQQQWAAMTGAGICTHTRMHIHTLML